MRVVLRPAHGTPGYTIRPVSKGILRMMEKQTGDSAILFQADWEYPALAGALGWNMRSRQCSHRWTDGTVTCCDCGKTAEEFIAEATTWLHAHEGQVFQGTNADEFVLHALGIQGGW